jgi:hypothetical protein
LFDGFVRFTQQNPGGNPIESITAGGEPDRSSLLCCFCFGHSLLYAEFLLQTRHKNSLLKKCFYGLAFAGAGWKRFGE